MDISSKAEEEEEEKKTIEDVKYITMEEISEKLFVIKI
jgi:hypothetical protein